MVEKQYQDFISTVSHELRTPLTSIRGFSQTLLSSWDKIDDESKKKFLQIIEQQSNRLIGLVENMLSVSKLQSDDNFIYKNHNVQSVVDTVIQIVSLQYKSHKFKTKYNKNLPEIYVDGDKFQQILVNLIENAAKYSEEGSEILVSADFAEDFVSIKVIDEGIGIEEKDEEKIFSKFSRLDNPLTRKVQGSGLGLYITKILVDKMKGKIDFYKNNNGKGTTFEIKMPVSDLENQARVKCSPKH